MALLGHVARLVLHTGDVASAQQMLQSVGFDDGEATSYGQRLLVVVAADGAAAPSLLYAAPSLQSVADRLTAAGVPFIGTLQTELHLIGPGHLHIRVVAAHAEDMEERRGLDNPELGFLDSIVVPVADASAAADWAQKCGFFILETSDVGAPMIDVTDGLVKLSFRQQELRAPYLHYTADIDASWCDDMKDLFQDACSVMTGEDGIELVHVNLAGVLQIMVTPDEF